MCLQSQSSIRQGLNCSGKASISWSELRNSVLGNFCFAIFILQVEKGLSKRRQGGGFDMLAPRFICCSLQHQIAQLRLLECHFVYSCVFRVAGSRATFAMAMSNLAIRWTFCLGCCHGNVGMVTVSAPSPVFLFS